MKSNQSIDYSDEGLYQADDVYGATSDFWGDAEEEDTVAPDSDSGHEADPPETAGE